MTLTVVGSGKAADTVVQAAHTALDWLEEDEGCDCEKCRVVREMATALVVLVLVADQVPLH